MRKSLSQYECVEGEGGGEREGSKSGDRRRVCMSTEVDDGRGRSKSKMDRLDRLDSLLKLMKNHIVLR